MAYALNTAAVERCPVETTVEIIGGKWKTVLMYHLVSGEKTVFATATARSSGFGPHADAVTEGVGSRWAGAARGVCRSAGSGRIQPDTGWPDACADLERHEGVGQQPNQSLGRHS